MIKPDIKLFKLLTANKKIIAKELYTKVSKVSAYVGIVSQTVLLSFNRIKSVIRWFYASVIVTIFSYIASIYNTINDMVASWFQYVQKLGKYIILKFMEFTGPLEKATLDYLWLLFILVCAFITLLIIYKLLKYFILKYKIYKENKEEFKKELVEELKDIDDEINKEITKVEKLPEILKVNKEKEKEEIKIVNIKGVNYNITEALKRLEKLNSK